MDTRVGGINCGVGTSRPGSGSRYHIVCFRREGTGRKKRSEQRRVRQGAQGRVWSRKKGDMKDVRNEVSPYETGDERVGDECKGKSHGLNETPENV